MLIIRYVCETEREREREESETKTERKLGTSDQKNKGMQVCKDCFQIRAHAAEGFSLIPIGGCYRKYM